MFRHCLFYQEMLKKNWFYIVIAIGLLAFWWMRYKTVQNIDISNLQIQTEENNATSALSSFVSKSTIVHYYASWCGPCMRELPDLLEFSSVHPEFDVLLVTDDPWSKVQVLASKPHSQNVHFCHVSSLKEIGIYSIPVSYFTNANCDVVYSNLGETNWQSPSFLQELQKHY